MELTLHGACLIDAPRETVDIGVAAGRIVAIRPGLAPGERSVTVGGRLVIPGFCESHIHLDKACILDRCRMPGGIDGAIAEVSELKRAFTEEDVAHRASRALRKCVLNGTTRMRTHVEVDPTIGMRGFDGVRAAIRDWAAAIDVEICVFPQEGLIGSPETDALLVEGLERGARVIGAAPYTDRDPLGQIDRIFELAEAYDADIDMHLDFGPTAEGLTIEHVCRRTEETGWGGRVAVGHVTRFARLLRPDFAVLTRRLQEAGVAVTVLPATDLFMMHSTHAADCDPPRGVTPVHLMAAEGVTCSLSTNNMLNPFTPFGDGSLVRMANLYANIAQLGDAEGMAGCFEMVTGGAARLMNLGDYGIAVGAPADLVVLDARNAADAVAELAPPLWGFKDGRPIFTRAPPELHLTVPTRAPGRPHHDAGDLERRPP
ncbi:MAG: amidohydrolase family protein [Paracoccaceae bacterium]